MKITRILQKNSQYPEVDQKYQPLKKNLRHLKKPQIQTNVQKISYISRRLKSLSPEQIQKIKTVTYIPQNCRLKVTSNEEKQKQAFSQKYIAIDMEQSQKLKPITPNTFKNVSKNQKVQIVYEYNCPNRQNLVHQQSQQGYQSKAKSRVRQQNLLENQNIAEVNQSQFLNYENRNTLASQKTQKSIMDRIISIGSDRSQNLRKDQGSPQSTFRQDRSSKDYTEFRDNRKSFHLHSDDKNSNIGYVANQQIRNYDGPAFFQVQGRNRYNQLNETSREGNKINLRKIKYDGTIEIGGRSKSISKRTIEDNQSSIPLNSRRDLKNPMNSTRDYSNNYDSKQNYLEVQQTYIGGDYHKDQYQEIVNRDSDKNGFSKQVQSRLVSRTRQNQKFDVPPDNQKVIQVHSSKYTGQIPQLQVSAEYVQSNPEIEERSRKLKQYQQSGRANYNFKRNQDSNLKRKKQNYKYNLFSVCDEQFNLKCATGILTPNQICASKPKRQAWN